jgi:chromate transporter
MIYLELFWTFFLIGAFTFGGGYAMLPLVQAEVAQRGWIPAQELVDFVAVSESTPGPFAVNMATYVGSEVAGVFGAVCATLGVVLPSFVIIYLVSMFLDSFLSISIIANAFKGIKVGVGILILRAGLNMGKKLPKNNLTRVITLCSLSVMLLVNIFSLKISTITLMLAAGIVGISAAVCRKDGADV